MFQLIQKFNQIRLRHFSVLLVVLKFFLVVAADVVKGQNNTHFGCL